VTLSAASTFRLLVLFWWAMAVIAIAVVLAVWWFLG
jgi:hypothetical protein